MTHRQQDTGKDEGRFRQAADATGAILLDKDGVLVDFHATWKPAIKRAAVAVATLALEAADDDILPAAREISSRSMTEAEDNLPTSDAVLDACDEPARRLAVHLLRQVGYEPRQDVFLPGSIWAAGTQEELFDAWAMILPALPREHMVQTVSAILQAAEPHPVVPPSILLPLMQEARARGCKLAVVTNDLTASARSTAERQGMSALLDAIIGSDLCTRPKPYPDLVWHASRELGVPPSRMLMIGDNVHDAEMALSAGCAGFIGVLSGTSGREDLAPLADMVVEDVAAALRHALQGCASMQGRHAVMT